MLGVAGLTMYRHTTEAMRGIQLPVSAARRQHSSQMCFETFIWRKNHKIDKNSTTTKAREKIRTDLESLEF
jgi:hypothetical protein